MTDFTVPDADISLRIIQAAREVAPLVRIITRAEYIKSSGGICAGPARRSFVTTKLNRPQRWRKLCCKISTCRLRESTQLSERFATNSLLRGDGHRVKADAPFAALCERSSSAHEPRQNIADRGLTIRRELHAHLGLQLCIGNAMPADRLSDQNLRLLRADIQPSSPSFVLIRRAHSTRTHRRRDIRAFPLRSGRAQKSFLRRYLLQRERRE